MLVLYWTRTSASGTAASGLPFGPLRYRGWTSPSEATDAGSGLPFGPLRFRAWTNGPAVEPEPEQEAPATSGGIWRRWDKAPSDSAPQEAVEALQRVAEEQVRAAALREAFDAQKSILALQRALDAAEVEWDRRYLAMLARIRAELMARQALAGQLAREIVELAAEWERLEQIEVQRRRNEDALRVLVMLSLH
jgi:hypothetical protein